MEMFHNTVPHLAAVRISFEVLSGITIEQTRDLIEKMNDQIVGVVVTPSSAMRTHHARFTRAQRQDVLLGSRWLARPPVQRTPARVWVPGRP